VKSTGISVTKAGISERKINELATDRNNKNITDLYSGINEFKRGYQPRSIFLFPHVVRLSPHDTAATV
jgi:hypothetical protein